MVELRNAWIEAAAKDGGISVKMWLDECGSRESLLRKIRQELGLPKGSGDFSVVKVEEVPKHFIGRDKCVTEEFYEMMEYLSKKLDGEDIDVLPEWAERTHRKVDWSDWRGLVDEYKSHECGMYETEEDFAYENFMDYFGVDVDAMEYVDLKKWADVIFGEKYKFIAHHVFEVD